MTAATLTRLTYLPLAIGLMIGPTLAYDVAVHPELGKESISLQGFPLPWRGDALIGSGPPTDIFVYPALLALVFYLGVCFVLWQYLSPRLQRARPTVRRGVVGAVWLYAGFAALLVLATFVFDGHWHPWYPTDFYQGLLQVRVGLFE